MEKKNERFHINGKYINVPVLHAEPDELVPAFQVGQTTIYRCGTEYWAKIKDIQHHSQLYSLRHCPSDIYLADESEEGIKDCISGILSMEMACGNGYYEKVCEPRYYIGSNPHLRLVEETHSIEQARWVTKRGFRVYNAYEYDKAQQVAQMITFLVHEKPKGEDEFPTPRIQVLAQNYVPTIGGDPVPGVLLTQSDLRKLSALELEFYAGRDEYLETLQESYCFVGPFEEIMKVIMGKRDVVPYAEREKAVEEHLALSGDVYAVTDDELDDEQIGRIADIIRTCDVREIHYAAARVLDLHEGISFPILPIDGEDIPFDTIRESVKDYLEFSHLTSKLWAFNLPFEQITRQHIDLIAAVAGSCDTEAIHLAADCILGTNPVLLSDPATTETEDNEDETEGVGDYGMAMIFTSPRGKKIRFDAWGSSEDEHGNPLYWACMCRSCRNKYRSILGNRIQKSNSIACGCYVIGCKNQADYYVDFTAEDVTFVEDFNCVPGSFEYGGYHFVPVGTFKNKEFNEVVKKLRTDPELGICTEGYTYPCKYPYSHESFYDASTVKTADVFRCLENGKNYTACQNDLQLYEGEYTALGLEDWE